jgi:hypothetical protein
VNRVIEDTNAINSPADAVIGPSIVPQRETMMAKMPEEIGHVQKSKSLATKQTIMDELSKTYYVKNEFGGFLLVHEDYIYYNEKVKYPKKRVDKWICEKHLNNKGCKGEVFKEMNQFCLNFKHKHPANPADQQKFAGHQKYFSDKERLSDENLNQMEHKMNLYHDGFKYNYKDVKNGRRSYLCLEEECPGRMMVNLADGLAEITMQHDHKRGKVLTGIQVHKIRQILKMPIGQNT